MTATTLLGVALIVICAFVGITGVKIYSLEIQEQDSAYYIPSVIFHWAGAVGAIIGFGSSLLVAVLMYVAYWESKVEVSP